MTNPFSVMTYSRMSLLWLPPRIWSNSGMPRESRRRGTAETLWPSSPRVRFAASVGFFIVVSFHQIVIGGQSRPDLAQHAQHKDFTDESYQQPEQLGENPHPRDGKLPRFNLR